MPKFRVFGTASASINYGVFDAPTKEAAIEMAQIENPMPSLCHQCADEVELGDAYEWEAEEE